MKIEVLIATMYNNDILKLVNDMNIQTDCIVVNQTNCKVEKIENKKYKNQNIKIIDTPERGLSRSRNKAIENISEDTDIVIFTDDDIRFEDNYGENIIKEYKENPRSDGIVFNVKRVSGRLNKKLPKKIGCISLFRVCSVSMTFRANSIIGEKFDTDFGAGSGKFVLGEENIFVNDFLKNNKIITTSPFIMCSIEEKRESTWFKGMDDKYLISKGASFKRMHKYLYMFLNFDFAVRKYKLYKENYNFIQALKTLFNGSNCYKKEIKNGQTC